MAATAGRKPGHAPGATLLGTFENAEAAAQYAATHDVGEVGPRAVLPAARGGTIAVHLDPGLLRRLRREAVRRGTTDLPTLVRAVLAETLPMVDGPL